jgi:hypothetical protein
MSAFSPDVLVIDLDTLVDDGAIERVSPQRRKSAMPSPTRSASALRHSLRDRADGVRQRGDEPVAVGVVDRRDIAM